MKPFPSASVLLDAHEFMFGPAGRTCAEIVLNWAPKLFAEPIDPLAVRVVLAPIELGPYNKHTGYHVGDGRTTFILGNRNQCAFCSGELVLHDRHRIEDFIVHELTHARQKQLHQQNGWTFAADRGAHRDKGWYTAVAEACPTYLGAQLPASSWPTGPRTRGGTLTEVDMTHWPGSLRALVEANDARFQPIAPAASLHINSCAVSQGRRPATGEVRQ
jgi:hypothetical protein